MRQLRSARSRGVVADAGESLVELLVSIVMMGIAATGILGAVGMASTSSATHEGLAGAQGHLRNWAESLTYSSACPAAVNSYAPPSGYTAGTPSVTYWNPATQKFNGSCGAAAGLYRVTLSITATGGQGTGIPQELQVTVRRPCAGSLPTPC